MSDWDAASVEGARFKTAFMPAEIYITVLFYKRGLRLMKTAVIDVGGGLRGIYAAGVLDFCIENKITFDVGIGVSAGSANLASFFAGQKGRNYKFYTEYAARKEYMSFRNFITKKSYVNLDYVYSTLSNSDGEYPIDYAAMNANPAEFIIVAANALTGGVKYFDKSDISQDNYDVFKASSAIPYVCRPYVIDGVPYYDGALGDPVPVAKAFSMGCDKAVLILTKPKDLTRVQGKDKKLASMIKRRYPLAAAALLQRAENYNKGVELAKEYEKQGKAIIIAPDDTCGIDTLTHDMAAMKRFYEKGVRDGGAIASFMKSGG